MNTKEMKNRFDRNGYQVLMNVSSVTIIDPNGEGERFDTLEDAYKYYFELY